MSITDMWQVCFYGCSLFSLADLLPRGGLPDQEKSEQPLKPFA
ncbi:hypothetical protein [Desulfovibrio sp. 1188_IL3213]